MIVAGVVGRILNRTAHTIGLGWLDRLVGAAFGFLKGCIVVTLGVMALAAFYPQSGWLDHSRLAPYFLSAAHTTTAVTPAELGERIREGVKIIRDAQPDWLKPHAEGWSQRRHRRMIDRNIPASEPETKEKGRDNTGQREASFEARAG